MKNYMVLSSSQLGGGGAGWGRQAPGPSSELTTDWFQRGQLLDFANQVHCYSFLLKTEAGTKALCVAVLWKWIRIP